MFRAKHRAGRSRRALADDDRRGARFSQDRRITRIRKKREISLTRLLQPGDAADFQRTVPFEPAIQALG
jgi:hypothetical protein